MPGDPGLATSAKTSSTFFALGGSLAPSAGGTTQMPTIKAIAK